MINWETHLVLLSQTPILHLGDDDLSKIIAVPVSYAYSFLSPCLSFVSTHFGVMPPPFGTSMLVMPSFFRKH